MNKKSVGLICKYIHDNFENNYKIEVNKYIIDNENKIIEYLKKYGISSADDICYYALDHEDFIMDVYNEKYLNEKYKTIEIKKISSSYWIENSMKMNEEDIKLKNKLLKLLDSLSLKEDNSKGIEFENICCKFLNDSGIKSNTTKTIGDFGIDIIGNYHRNDSLVNNLNSIKIIAQCKCYNKPIGIEIIKTVISNTLFSIFEGTEISYYDKNKGHEKLNFNPFLLCVFSSNGFTEASINYAEKRGVYLLDSNEIINLIVKNINKYNKTIEYILSLDSDLMIKIDKN